MTIASEFGKGTTVTLYLPRSAERRRQEQEEEPDAGARSGAVLLVEDNPEVAEVTPPRC